MHTFHDLPPGMAERCFDDPAALTTALVAELREVLAGALRERGRAGLVVSGGRTPVPLFRALRRQSLDWSRVQVTLADERWVEPDHPASNEGMVRRELLQEAASAARFLGLKTEAPSPGLGLEEAWRRIDAMPRPFDMVLLGMGEDGHTASLFPGSPGLGAALDPAAAPGCVAMSAPTFPHERISLNLAALAQTRRAVLHITGGKKWEVYRAAARRVARGEGGPGAGPPVEAILGLPLPGLQVWWSP